ncbi:MAG: hypothetical protein G01um101418_360 [Parcubacteria group bacterium Gr01-1014_18]|nr:MAG: hypothetical protein Greene041636_264 [Parcubacteria group bacterium Greene0416_36]TSC81220.1 MAG: hypothetical protein G01um101418_360 [Parcubacteria group bacterium Gr01-1014_18]TSC99217.1 MAG: hypothetical protein Greene101420_362 [Parcubacteria group bacterium Greene1014_20]TSD07425.1 MAG: hypothetical protein Greene07142_124 [Parcubacteria group bacterium Greene0714_2]
MSKNSLFLLISVIFVNIFSVNLLFAEEPATEEEYRPFRSNLKPSGDLFVGMTGSTVMDEFGDESFTSLNLEGKIRPFEWKRTGEILTLGAGAKFFAGRFDGQTFDEDVLSAGAGFSGYYGYGKHLQMQVNLFYLYRIASGETEDGAFTEELRRHQVLFQFLGDWLIAGKYNEESPWFPTISLNLSVTKDFATDDSFEFNGIKLDLGQKRGDEYFGEVDIRIYDSGKNKIVPFIRLGADLFASDESKGIFGGVGIIYDDFLYFSVTLEYRFDGNRKDGFLENETVVIGSLFIDVNEAFSRIFGDGKSYKKPAYRESSDAGAGWGDHGFSSFIRNS